MQPDVDNVLVLETGRLVLRRLTVDDAPFVLELLNEPSFLRFIGDKGVRDLEGARTYIATGPMASYARHGFGLNLVLRKVDGVPIGMCGLLKRDTLPDVDIGYAFLPAYRRQGYAFEAASAVLRQGLHVLGLRRIVAIMSPDNEGSKAILMKLGMHAEGSVVLEGSESEICLFAIEA